MRYDTPVYFRKEKAIRYNPKTGDYDDPEIEETAYMASVVNTRDEYLERIYGKAVSGSLTVHLQNKVPGSFDRIRIKDRVYSVDYVRTLRVKQAFIVSEDKNENNVGR